jgi:hypothetical protein
MGDGSEAYLHGGDKRPANRRVHGGAFKRNKKGA